MKRRVRHGVAVAGGLQPGTYKGDRMSTAAGESLADAGVRGIRQKGLLDQVAAQHILETYFSMRNDLA